MAQWFRAHAGYLIIHGSINSEIVRSLANAQVCDMAVCAIVHVIYQTRETVFHRDIQKLRRELKYDAQRSIFDEFRGVWIADETLSRVFDISSQSKQRLRSKRRSKIVKIYAN